MVFKPLSKHVKNGTFRLLLLFFLFRKCNVDALKCVFHSSLMATRSRRLCFERPNIDNAAQRFRLHPFQESIFGKLTLSFVIMYSSVSDITIKNVIIWLTSGNVCELNACHSPAYTDCTRYPYRYFIIYASVLVFHNSINTNESRYFLHKHSIWVHFKDDNRDKCLPSITVPDETDAVLVLRWEYV